MPEFWRFALPTRFQIRQIESFALVLNVPYMAQSGKQYLDNNKLQKTRPLSFVKYLVVLSGELLKSTVILV